MKIELFGEQLDVPYDQSVGGLANSLKVTLTGNQQSVSIDFKGEHPFGTAEFNVTLKCSVEGGFVRLKPVADAGARDAILSVTFPLNLGFYKLSKAKLCVATDGKLMFVDEDARRASLLQRSLGSIAITKDLTTFDWTNAQVWSRFGVDLWIKEATLFFAPLDGPGSELIVSDIFESSAHREQTLRIQQVIATKDAVEVTALPAEGFLLIHPEILTTVPSSVASNDFLYQHALVNGAAKLHFSGDNGTTRQYAWSPRPIDQTVPVGMLLYRLTDEHGNPLALQLAIGDSLRLGLREGTQVENIDGISPERWEMTNPALVVHAGDDGVGVNIRSINPHTVGIRFNDREKRWLGNHDLVDISSKPPLEIHGLAKGAYLRRNDQSPSIAGGKLVSKAVSGSGITNLFTLTSLEFPLPKDSWTLQAQLEERDVVNGETVKGGPAGQRTSDTPGHPNFKLPAIDTSYALANLADPGGRVGQGHILSAGTSWLKKLDQQLTTSHFSAPAPEMRTHTSEFVISPLEAKSYGAVLDMPPGFAASPAETAKLSPEMVEQPLLYVFGGKREIDQVKTLRTDLENRSALFVPNLKKFEDFWNRLALADPEDLAARYALRAEMGLTRRLNMTEAEMAVMYDTALQFLAGSRKINWPEAAVIERLRHRFENSTLVQFSADWTNNPSSPAPVDRELTSFLDLVSSDVGPVLYRRAAKAIESPGAELSKYVARLKTKIPSSITSGEFPAFPVPSFGGIDAAVAAFSAAWETVATIEQLRNQLGKSLTIDVYQRLLTKANIGFLETFLREYFMDVLFRTDLFAHLGDLQKRLKNLWENSVTQEIRDLRQKYSWPGVIQDATVDAADRLKLFNAIKDDLVGFYCRLRFDPPEYLVFSTRVPMSVGTEVENEAERMWTQQFRLANLGSNKSWSFMLDSESTVIVKLAGTRSLDQIVAEVQASYKKADRDNPLGIPNGDISTFVNRLDPAIRTAAWRGALVIRPTADLGQDEQLKNLTGMSQIGMIYAAIGGGRPDGAHSDPNSLDAIDVYANIFCEREALPLDVQNPSEDLDVALIKFDATIQNTRLVAGEVIFQLKIRNTFGRDSADEKQFQPLKLRGIVPRDKKNEGSSFEFSGWFEHSITYPLNFIFFKDIEFRMLRVTVSRGQTAVDIDADIHLRDWKPIGEGPGFSIEAGDPDSKLQLQNFRILFPDFKNTSVPIGVRRLLNFELPALSFNWPKPRPINLGGGIELAPLGFGMIRRVGEAKEALDSLRARYMWLNGDPSGYQLPYLRCSIHFGKLPSLGGTQLSRLDFELVVAFELSKLGDLEPKIRVGLGDVDGKEITIDLFGIIKLEIQKVILGRFKFLGVEAVALVLDNPRLSIFGWSPLPEEAKLQFLCTQSQTPPHGRAALGFYTHGQKIGGADPDKQNDRFFQLFWLLVGHNLELDPSIIRYLMSETPPGNGHDLLEKLVDTDKKEIAAKILEDDSWIFGVSFKLKDIVDHGTLILHDQHYYGIALRGPPIKALFGVERLELAYIPGPTRAQDRFRAGFRIPALDFIGNMRCGDLAVEWGFNWDFLLDFGFPWKSGAAYLWERAFSLPMGAYEAKFGLYFEKRSQVTPAGAKQLTIGAGIGFYFGYYIGFGKPGKWVWAQAGIGIFAILEGSVTFEFPSGNGVAGIIKGTVKEVMVRGVLGLYAYGEGGIEIWVISARFRVSAQAALAGEFHYLPGAASTLKYGATLSAGYSASCRIGHGWFSWTFEVSGSIDFEVSGQAVLN